MNSLFNRLKYFFTHGRKMKRMMLSIVILAEVIVLLVVATYAWVETVSSIKITNEGNTKGIVDTYVFTEAEIGGGTGTIDIAKYFKQSGDMHLAPASSADGTTLFFPMVNNSSNNYTAYNKYRKGNVSDKNTAYLSVSFKIRTDANADFFFDKGTNDQGPSFSALEDDIRVSVTSQSEGSTSAPVTTIYSKNASTTAVVNSTSGGTGATTVAAYSDHIKGTGTTNRLFAVGANETKIITINIWLQKKPGDENTDLTDNMSQAVTINNFGITSSNSYNVTAHACYTSDTGTTYTTDDSTGGTVKAGSSAAGATSTASVKYKSTVNLVASPASGYYFVGWYSASSGGTELSTNTTYTYTLSTTGNKDVYARFKHRNRLYLKTNLNEWGTTAEMTPDSNGVYTYTASNVPEGGIAKFKIHNTTSNVWYGKENTTITETCSDVVLSTNDGYEYDIVFEAHAGSYTFTFNSNNNQLTITRNSYNNITITFDTSSTQWVGDNSAIVWFDSDQGNAQMTKNSNSNWTVSVPSNYATGISFKRNDSENTETWNKWENEPDRGYKTTYKTSGDGSGDWQ